MKLKLSTSQPPKSESQASPPLTTPSSSTGLKLKFGKKTVSQTPDPQPPSSTSAPTLTAKPKPARKPKPTPKKRALEEDPNPSTDEEQLASVPSSRGPPLKKRFKLLAHGPAPPATPTGTTRAFIKAKAKGKPPERPLGVGYDSEASDREEDPTITESIILRMAPGLDCDYLRAAVAAGNFGKTKEGGADVRFRFLTADGRRATVSIRGNLYAAILADLPCIIEVMKSWFPKNGWMKSADICQMLMVLGPIKTEQDAMEYPLPLQNKGEFDEKTWQWAHGLTPPMHWVRKRRFRKRISVRTVMEVEAEVEDLLRKDEQCEGEPKIEVIEHMPDRGSEAPSEDIYGGEEEDAEGDLDDQEQDQDQIETPLDTIENEADPDASADPQDDEAENARMAELFERQMMAAATAESTSPPPPLPSTSFDSPTTPAVETSSAIETSSAAEESSDEDEEGEPDEDQLERQQEVLKLKEDVADLEAAVRGEQAKLRGTQNALLRKRLVDKIAGLQGDLELKVKALGGGGEG